MPRQYFAPNQNFHSNFNEVNYSLKYLDSLHEVFQLITDSRLNI